MKILLQRLWEAKLDWDDLIPMPIKDVWLHLNDKKLRLLSQCHVPRYPFLKDANIIDTQLHGFCDASEDAYVAVIYSLSQDGFGRFHIGLVMAKTKVAPLKRLTIPRLELCGTYLLAQLLHHVKNIYNIPITNLRYMLGQTVQLC